MALLANGMTWLKLQELKFFSCIACADTGFVPARRARLYSNRKQRPQDVKTVITYQPCSYCATVRWLRKANQEGTD